MYTRDTFLKKIDEILDITPVCAILGPRQCGKTTLALQYEKSFKGPTHHFDLENMFHREYLIENPMLTLENLEGLIILDEVQQCPNIFRAIRYLVDHRKQKFLILGSASRDLINQSSETLAGRILYMELTPFTLPEALDQKKSMFIHQCLGGFPQPLLLGTVKKASMWLEGYISTFIERDLSFMGIKISPHDMRRLWRIIAHYHGKGVNYSELGKLLSMTRLTVKRYMEILHGTFMIRLLQPWHENMSKRQVKSHKIYIRDSGICHYLLHISGYNNQSLPHPADGFLWEGYAIEEIIRSLDIPDHSFFFWKKDTGAELDLLIVHQGKRIGFEMKYADVPKISKGSYRAIEEVKLDCLYVVSPRSPTLKKEEKIVITSLEHIVKNIDSVVKQNS